MRRKQRKCRDRDAKKYRNAGRGKIKNRVDIDERPANVENRARVGNWDGDLINGLHGTGNLVTAVERMTRFTLVGYAATKETSAIVVGTLGSSSSPLSSASATRADSFRSSPLLSILLLLISSLLFLALLRR